MAKRKNKENLETAEIEYGFLVVKTKQGEHLVQVLQQSDVPEPNNVNDIYSSCETVCRNIQTQQTAELISKAMIVASQADKQGKGIVVPK